MSVCKTEILNTTGIECSLFYSKKLNRFILLDVDGFDYEGKLHDVDKLYETPYGGFNRWQTWKIFLESLTPEDKECFPDLETRKLTIGEVEDAGFGPCFHSIQNMVDEKLVDDWAESNGLAIDWETAVIG